jgi:hypothetical protein
LAVSASGSFVTHSGDGSAVYTFASGTCTSGTLILAEELSSEQAVKAAIRGNNAIEKNFFINHLYKKM